MLTISNTNLSSTSGTSTIRFGGDATNNIITNCTVLGSGSMSLATNGGVIFFHTAAASGTGNDNNTISNCKIGPAGTNLPSKGIYGNGSTTSSAIANSSITINNCEISDFFLATGCAGVYVLSGNTEWNISNNKIYQTASRAMTGTMTAIHFVNATYGDNVQITGNTIGYNSNTGTGTLTLNGSGNATFTGINFQGMPTAASACNISNNVVSNISVASGNVSPSFFGISNNTAFVAATNTNTISINGNTISNIATTNTNTAQNVGIYTGGATTLNIYDNTIHGLSKSGSTGALIAIQQNAIGSGTINMYRNRIYDLSTVSNTVYGIFMNNAVTTSNIYNNVISDLRAPSGATDNMINGIILNNGATHNLYHNTIFLSSSSSGANFGSSAIYVSATPTSVNLINNILVNTSTPNGTGRAVAFRRNAATLTAYGTTSNNNLFYTGNNPTATNPLYYDGTNAYVTLASFQAFVTSRETVSVTGSPFFVSASSLIPQFCEIDNMGVVVAAVPNDYSGTVRSLSTPDMGAYEFTSTPITVPVVGGAVTYCPNETAVALTATGTNTLLWFTSATGEAGVTSLIPSTATVGTTTYYVADSNMTTGCISSRVALDVIIKAGGSILSTTNASVCGSGSLILAATASAGTLNWYDAAIGGTLLDSGNTYTTPIISATTTYYVQADTNTCSSPRTAVVATINNSSTSNQTTIACDSFVWNGTTYYTSGAYTFTTTNSDGCDSVATLNLTINHSSASVENITACDSLVWNGTTYYTSGAYTFTTINSDGCDSVATLNLTINHSSASVENITACDSLVWNGTTYYTSGAYTFTTINSAGCDSVATLNLTINHSSASVENITACDSLVWNGTTYYTSGTYTYTTLNANNCDSVATLNLTINHPTTSTENTTACTSFSWNGTTYTTSGTYTFTTLNSVGCDSIATLNLTINTPIAGNTISGTQTICTGSTPVQFTGSVPTGGDGSTYTYEWLVSTNSATSGFTAIASSNTQNFTPSVLSATTWFKRVVISGVCAMDTTSAIEVTVNAPGTWTGAMSSAWNNTTNWSCPAIPTSATDVIISSGVSNMPIVTDAQQVANLTIQSGATLTLNASTSTLSIYGNITNNGTISHTDGKVTFAGSTTQTIPAGIYAKLEINNAADANLGGTVSLTDSLILTNGKLTLGSNNLILGNTSQASTGTSSSYVSTNGTGMLVVQNIGSTGKTGTVIFPVGNSTFNPVSLTNTGTADTYSVWVRDSVVDGGRLASGVVDRTWEIDEAVFGGSNVSVTLQWSGANELPSFVRSSSYVSRSNGLSWIDNSAAAATGSDPYSQTLTGITSFNPYFQFAIGSGSVLPVNLLSFTAAKQKQAVTLNWVTASEINNNHFIVQRSVDGIVFENIALVKGRGTTSNVSNYNFVDTKASSLGAGVVYYRLLQVDYDNHSEYSRVLTVDMGSTTQTTQVSVSPNPFMDITSVSVNTSVASQATLRVIDMQGRLVFEKTIELSAGLNPILVDELSSSAYSGVYFVNIVTPAESLVTRIVKAK